MWVTASPLFFLDNFGGKENNFLEGLFSQLVYSEYKNGILLPGTNIVRNQFWASQRGGPYSSGEYPIFNYMNYDTPYDCLALQTSYIKNEIKNGKNKEQFQQAEAFFQNVNQTIANIDSTLTEITSENELYKWVLKFLNSPLRGESKLWRSDDESNYETIGKQQRAVAKELESVVKQITENNKKINGIPKDLVRKLQQMLKQSAIPSESQEGKSASEISSANYRNIKAFEIEKMVVEFLNNNTDAEKIKNIYTGAFLDENNKRQIGADIMSIRVDVFNNRAEGGIKLSNGNIIHSFEELEKNLKAETQFIITNELYDVLNEASLFNTQVKSGINQAIYNQENSKYSVSLSELSDNHKFQLLQMVREWDSSFGQNKENKTYKFATNNAKHIVDRSVNKESRIYARDTNYFKVVPNSTLLNAMANMALTKDIIKLDLYRTTEYQLYFTDKGFITLAEYLAYYDKKIWMFTSNIDFRLDFYTKKRQIGLRSIAKNPNEFTYGQAE